MKHTPGPWGIYRPPAVKSNLIHVVSGKKGEMAYATDIGYVTDLHHTASEQDANARLIAAAPDLLHLAEHVLAMADDAYLTGHPEWIEIVEEARAIKARC